MFFVAVFFVEIDAHAVTPVYISIYKAYHSSDIKEVKNPLRSINNSPQALFDNFVMFFHLVELLKLLF